MSNKKIGDVVIRTVDEADGAVRVVVETTNNLISPYRMVLQKKFPFIYITFVTFGVVATYFGFERIISDIPWLIQHPWFILTVGLMTLVVTGALYKKLG